MALFDSESFYRIVLLFLHFVLNVSASYFLWRMFDIAKFQFECPLKDKLSKMIKISFLYTLCNVIFMYFIHLSAPPNQLFGLLFITFLLTVASIAVLYRLDMLYGENSVMHEKNKLYASLFQHHSSAVYFLSEAGTITDCNQAAHGQTEIEPHLLKTVNFLKLIESKDRSLFQKNFSQAINGESSSFYFSLLKKSGRSILLRANMIPSPVRNETTGVIILAEDISQIRKKDEEIAFTEFYDQLTGLYNKNYLLQQFMLQPVAQGVQHTYFHIDIDNFKKWNDLYSMSFGNDLLIEIGKRLKQLIVKGKDTVARIESDEFVILSTRFTADSAARFAEKIAEQLKEGFFINNTKCELTVSVGIAISDAKTTRKFDQLTRLGETAMQSAKEAKVHVFLYTPELDEKRLKELRLEKELRSSLQQDRFYIVYQPKIHSGTKKMIGVEALARWKHPQEGIIHPSIFIPIAEKYGLINELEERVFKKVCEQIKEWSDKLEFPFRVSVNISQLHFAQKDLYQFIKDTIAEIGIDARYLELEITESVMIMDDKFVIDQLTRIKELGIEISMDDFGTGYSSLNYINKLPIDRIKIDKSFINEIATDQKFRSIIKTIVTMADFLELDVIAEGVEKEEQLTFLTSIDCFKIQGYFYSPPVQKEQIRSFIDKQFKIA